MDSVRGYMRCMAWLEYMLCLCYVMLMLDCDYTSGIGKEIHEYCGTLNGILDKGVHPGYGIATTSIVASKFDDGKYYNILGSGIESPRVLWRPESRKGLSLMHLGYEDEVHRYVG